MPFAAFDILIKKMLGLIDPQILDPCDGYYVANKPITLPYFLSMFIVLGFEARKALQIFVQNNDCSGRC